MNFFLIIQQVKKNYQLSFQKKKNYQLLYVSFCLLVEDFFFLIEQYGVGKFKPMISSL